MDGQKLARLPKWAQKLIRDQARRIDRPDLEELRGEYAKDIEGGHEACVLLAIPREDGTARNEFPKRYINATTIRLRHNGIECELAARDGEIRLSFDLDRDLPHPGFKTKVVVVPDASNCLKLARMRDCDPVHTFDDAFKKA